MLNVEVVQTVLIEFFACHLSWTYLVIYLGHSVARTWNEGYVHERLIMALANFLYHKRKCRIIPRPLSHWFAHRRLRASRAAEHASSLRRYFIAIEIASVRDSKPSFRQLVYT